MTTTARRESNRLAAKRWREKYERRTGQKYSTLVYRIVHRITHEPRPCCVCGKVFVPAIHPNAETCSKRCVNVDQRLKRKGLN